ncbi:hypothetical protein [Desulfovibrio ferrophilus]|uniref:GA27408, isoform A n=1 Tax=Desulfovibrio ferrophilus TaxID=241368 RepID=A0A2Z6B1X3_9BACT|nr:hypothetical protein [Desulfovibrio ferrophilus]BBD09519.1 GA27408, isoform A [Desulfovibrio ferrophilus]
MRHLRQSYIALLLILILGATGCAGHKAVHADHADGQARAAVQDLLDAYANGPMMAFADQISQDFLPLRADFLNQVDTAKSIDQAVQFEFFVNQVLMKNQTMAVTVSWNKKAQTSAGQTMDQGRTEFVFHAENGLWKLSQTRGDNPF